MWKQKEGNEFVEGDTVHNSDLHNLARRVGFLLPGMISRFVVELDQKCNRLIGTRRQKWKLCDVIAIEIW